MSTPAKAEVISNNPSAKPKVSIIIPVFNDQDGLDIALSSLQSQTYPSDSFEVLVVDNGSCPPIRISDFEGLRVRILQCETPGSYAARNAGAEAASGEIFAFTDADCSPCKEWLERGVASLTAGKGKWVVGGDVRFVPTESPAAVALYQITTGFGQESNIQEHGFSATANLICTRTQFDAVGPFDPRLLSGGDREWCWRAAKLGLGLVFEPAAIVHTQPRTDLLGAIRQARRVAAGRKMLRELELEHAGPQALNRRRSIFQAASWILRRQNLGFLDRLRVLAVASVVRVAAAWEQLRLATGAAAERR